MTNAKTGAVRKGKLAVAADTSAAEAREQADEYDSIFGTEPLELDDGTTIDIPPHPDYGMLDDDAMQAWDELKFDVDTLYLRDPDIVIPPSTVKGDDGSEHVVPGETIRGSLRQPYQIADEDGKPQLVRPPHQVKVVTIALGEDGYKRLREGGRGASDVFKIWGRKSIEIRERQQRDSKSAGSTVDLAAVSEADS